MSNNRTGITLRFNAKELSDLNSLCEFWGRAPKDVLKLAFYQLVSGTHQLQNKLSAQETAVSQQQEQDTCEPTLDSSASDSVSESLPQSPAPESQPA